MSVYLSNPNTTGVALADVMEQGRNSWASFEITQVALAGGALSVAILALVFRYNDQIKACFYGGRLGNEDIQGLVLTAKDFYEDVVEGIGVFWRNCTDVAGGYAAAVQQRIEEVMANEDTF
ncbi:hypothetical protein BDD12DRAFT_883096 [Trichophaea hybrida]|nr:hypothetical protein BDD12DRAFT_883096 [Trichophaea hybrida]